MSAVLALSILQWVAIVVLYLGLAAVLRETRLLRSQVTRLQARLTPLATAPVVDGPLPMSLTGGRAGVVLVADTTCPTCALVCERVAARARLEPPAHPITVLTWEDPARWEHLAGTLPVVRDDGAWSAIAHLSPPILLRTAADGSVTAAHLPTDADDAESVLSSWGVLPAPDLTKATS